MASLASGKFISVSFESMFEQRGKERFFKTSYSLAMVISCDPHFCIQKLVTSRQSGTEQASRLIRMTLVTAPGSEGFTNHESLQLSSSARVLSGFVFRDLNITFFTRSLVQYSKTLDSSLNVFSEKGRKADVTRDLFSWEFLQGAIE